MSWEIPSGAVFNNTTQGADFLFRTKLNQTYSGYGLISDISKKEKTQNNEKLGLSKLVSLIPFSLIIESI